MFDFDDVGWGDELFDVVDDYAVVGVFADGAGVEDVLAAVDERAFECEGDDLKVVGVDDRGANAADGAASLDAKNGGADEV